MDNSPEKRDSFTRRRKDGQVTDRDRDRQSGIEKLFELSIMNESYIVGIEIWESGK